MADNRSTLFIDIDGTIFAHKGDYKRMLTETPIVTPGTIEWLYQKREDGFIIILTTARAEGARPITEKQLADTGIPYDQLVMGIGTGRRYVINDTKPAKHGKDEFVTVGSIAIKRDSGLGKVVLP